jgi:multidrug efflux pump subunit AcrA (membrane-fusion protein)
MNKLLLLFTLTVSTLMGVDIPVETSEIRSFGKSLNVNAQIMQLHNTRQAIMPLVDGHIEKYYVKPGQKVTANQKIALIDSIVLSEMTAEYLSLQEQYTVLSENYAASKQLYDKGMLALQDLNRQAIEKESINSKLKKLKSQLLTLGVKAQTLTQASSEYTLYAHSDGIVNEILQPLHSVVGTETPIVSIVKESALYAKAYVPLRYANVLKPGQKSSIAFANTSVGATLTQILPEVDLQTQRITALFAIDDTLSGPYINAFVPLSIYVTDGKEYVAVKKSALSFFQNEWVVFIPKEHEIDLHEGHNHDEIDHDIHEHEGRMWVEGPDEHNEHTEDAHEGHNHDVPDRDIHDEHDHDAHMETEEHNHEVEHDGHKEEEGHDEHAEDVAYDIRVVEIITQDDQYAAVKGLDAGEQYVSDKSYYVKSMLLKSSLGGHGH